MHEVGPSLLGFQLLVANGSVSTNDLPVCMGFALESTDISGEDETMYSTQGWKKGVPLTEKPVRQKGSRITILVLKRLSLKGSLSFGSRPFTWAYSILLLLAIL